MKQLKLDHKLAQSIQQGRKRSVWRLNDDKDITVGDELELIDKVNPATKQSWEIIGRALVTDVIETTLKKLTNQQIVEHEMYESTDDMLKTLQSYYGADAKLDSPLKIITFSFTPLTKPYLNKISEQDSTILYRQVVLYADGGSRGNPGPSASGYVLYDLKKEVLESKGIYIGITTNNQAEYQALKYGLEAALKLQARIVAVHMDSLLVVNQMKHIFKVKNRDLWPIHDAIVDLLAEFEEVSFTHVPRELNKAADQAVNNALDEALGIIKDDK